MLLPDKRTSSYFLASRGFKSSYLIGSWARSDKGYYYLSLRLKIGKMDCVRFASFADFGKTRIVDSKIGSFVGTHSRCSIA